MDKRCNPQMNFDNIPYQILWPALGLVPKIFVVSVHNASQQVRLQHDLLIKGIGVALSNTQKLALLHNCAIYAETILTICAKGGER